jgi:hypothetical protein
MTEVKKSYVELDVENRALLAEQTALRNEIQRLKAIEAKAVTMRQITQQPNGELMHGLVYEAVDRDGDGVVDDLVLVTPERKDTIVLSPAELRKSEALRLKLLTEPPSGPSQNDALQFSAAGGSGPSEAQQILEAAAQE